VPQFKHIVLSLLASMVIPAASALATVTLALTDQDATPLSTTVAKGSNFTVRLNLTSTSEQTTGLDYFLAALGSGSGHFYIVDRDISTSPYADPSFVDSVVEAQPDSVLNPRNAWDLGATLNNVNSALNSGTYLVANYTIHVNADTPNATYTIEAQNDPNIGWIGNSADNFNDHPFSPPPADFAVTVTPEPTFAVFGIPTMAFLLSPRRKLKR